MPAPLTPELIKVIQRHRQLTNVDTLIGYLGDGSGSGEPRLSDGSGRWWVRLAAANGFTPPFALPADTNANLPVADNIPVEIGFLGGNQIILRAYREGMIISGQNPVITNPNNPEPHINNSTAYLTEFQCKRSADPAKPWSVIVQAGYRELDGVGQVFSGDEIDLSSFVPGGGELCLAVVFLQADLMLVAYVSSNVLSLDSVTVAMINECLDQAAADDMTIWGWWLYGDASGLTQDVTKNIDLRPIFEIKTTTVSTGSYPPPIDLINSTYAIADNTQAVVNRFEISGSGSLTLAGTGAVYFI